MAIFYIYKKMSIRKPLNKYNKAELYQLAKDNRDIQKSLKQNLTMAMEEIDTLKVKVSDLTEKLRESRQRERESQKVLTVIKNQKKLLAEESGLTGKPKKVRNLRNLFGLLS